MSINAISWAWDQEYAPTPIGDWNGGTPAMGKLILVLLADNSDDAGVTYAGEKSTGVKCNTSDRTVRRYESAFVEQGLIAKVRRERKNGSRSSDYIVLAPNGDRQKLVEADPGVYPIEVVELTKRTDLSSRSDETKGETKGTDLSGIKRTALSGRQEDSPVRTIRTVSSPSEKTSSSPHSNQPSGGTGRSAPAQPPRTGEDRVQQVSDSGVKAGSGMGRRTRGIGRMLIRTPGTTGLGSS